jgi:hypothetical protein
MKAIRFFFLNAVLMFYSFCFSQNINMTKEVDQMLKSGKDSIINMALNMLDKNLTTDNFARISIMTNGQEVLVLFSNPIKYVPRNTSYCFDASVYLIEKQQSYSPISNPADYQSDNVVFYKKNDEAEKNIQFVVDAINNSGEVGPFDQGSFEDAMIILDNKKYYEISVVSEYIESWYKIDKSTGRIYDSGHAHLIDPPIEDVISPAFQEVRF